jgi:3-mercaptopyruvate sulfurtransferase SseA
MDVSFDDGACGYGGRRFCRGCCRRSGAAEIVVYCANRQCQNSHIAAHHLSVLGYTNVSVYTGGKQDWEEAGLPFESQAEATAA